MCAWVVNYCLRFLLLVSKFYVNQCPWGWKLGKNGWLASHEIWRVQTYFSELIQWIASTLKGKLITEIMQLGSLRRTEIRIHWERKKKKVVFFCIGETSQWKKIVHIFKSANFLHSHIMHQTEKGEGRLFFFFGPWCAQGSSLEINDLGTGKIILAIITTMYQWFSNASVRQSMLYKGHLLLFHLIWSLWQPQEVHMVSITVTVLHMRILSCGGGRVLCAESQS